MNINDKNFLYPGDVVLWSGAWGTEEYKKAKDIVCTPVYDDDNRSLNYIINNFLKENRISLSLEIKNILIERYKNI